MPKNPVSQADVEKKGGGERVRGGGGVLKNHCFVRGRDSETFAGWDFAKIWKSLRNLNGPFLTFLPTFLSL
jgi:hypothetical protein